MNNKILIVLIYLLVSQINILAQVTKYSGGNGDGYSSSSYFKIYAPATFTVTETGIQTITLTWNQNASNDSVLVAYNTTNTFGTPIDGTVYSADGTISGGGTVTLNDSSTSFAHTFLTGGTTYYYKVWSLNSNKYSSGNTASSSLTLSAAAILGRYSGGSGAGYGSGENGNSPLPVELTGFTALVTENNVVLNWQTATEINNYGFEIERQASSISAGSASSTTHSQEGYTMIGFVEGHGNSNSQKDYTFTDKKPPSGKIQYRLKQIDTDGQFEYSDIVEVEVGLPTKFKLFQNYPNPFNPATQIKFGLPKTSKVILTIYNVLGEIVETLINKEMDAGIYNIRFNAANLASGFYIYRMQVADFISTKKMLFIK